MSHFDDETKAVLSSNNSGWSIDLSSDWDIGDHANGGYALSPVLRVFSELGDHPDPLSVTTSYLRPTAGGHRAHIDAEVIRSGRTTTVARGSLSQDGRERLVVMATMGDLGKPAVDDREITIPAPDLPSPDECRARAELPQGIDIPMLGRIDARIHPERSVMGTSSEAVMEGWIRFTDETDPSPLALALFADAFPPSLFSLYGRVGWVPTIEMTVHVRRRPAPGWVSARFECDDLANGRMIETGTLWDSTGTLVARSRQIGLLLSD